MVEFLLPRRVTAQLLSIQLFYIIVRPLRSSMRDCTEASFFLIICILHIKYNVREVIKNQNPSLKSRLVEYPYPLGNCQSY